MIDLKEILALSGQPGLFQMVKHAKNSIIVESIVTGKRMPAYSSHKISALEDIAIFTNTEDVLLGKVFKNIYDLEEGKATQISHKASAKELKSYFEKILPDYDQDRVYVSDMKRVIQWYNVLEKANLLKIKEEKPEPVKEEKEKKAEKETPENKD